MNAAAPPFSDEALALRFAAAHTADVRFVAPWGKWLIRDGDDWRVDDTLLVLDMVRHTCREAAAECTDEPRAWRIASAKTVMNVLQLARSDRRFVASSNLRRRVGCAVNGSAPPPGGPRGHDRSRVAVSSLPTTDRTD